MVSEAIVAGVPIIASQIPGNMGLLGWDYPGYFPLQNETALAAILELAETHPSFIRDLNLYGSRLRSAFLPHQEAAGWYHVIKLVT